MCEGDSVSQSQVLRYLLHTVLYKHEIIYDQAQGQISETALPVLQVTLFHSFQAFSQASFILKQKAICTVVALRVEEIHTKTSLNQCVNYILLNFHNPCKTFREDDE